VEDSPSVAQNNNSLILEEPWRMAINLAWDAFIGGNLGVGAVLTDPSGSVVAVGRNRQLDREAPPGRLRSTAIAYAELDVLAQLAPSDYRHHTLWTTLEPCPLCSMAIVMSNVGKVAFAARDRPWEGISRLTQLNEFIASRWPIRCGPLDGPVSVFCELLPLLWFLEHKPAGSVIERYEGGHPQLLALARSLSRDALLTNLKAHPVDAALNQLWAELSAIDNTHIVGCALYPITASTCFDFR
jgi:tRNA(Arg) A34 adenosine deaminase TadA